MPDDKSDQDVTEHDDDEDMDLKIVGNTDEDVRGYDEISVIENDNPTSIRSG